MVSRIENALSDLKRRGGYNQGEVAALLGMSPDHLSRCRRGRSEPSEQFLRHLELWCQFLRERDAIGRTLRRLAEHADDPEYVRGSVELELREWAADE